MTPRRSAVVARASRLATIATLVGPHPIQLARTFLFLAARARHRRRLTQVYSRPLAPATVELRTPPIDLPRLDALPVELREHASRLREEAEHVLAHRVDFLGSGLVDLGPEIDWHVDFKSGYRWPERFYREIEVTRLDDTSDAKVPWELSRCHQLLTLARAASLFEDERYRVELERQLASWIDANPPGVGINWTNAMEVGIRAVNLVWAVATIDAWRPLSPSLRARLVDSLRWHGRHIEANLEGTPYLRSNHYLGDILGLLVLGAALDGEPAAARWSVFARREFEREVAKQVHEDGVSFEGSLAYHGLVLEMFLLARHIAAWSGTPLSSSFDERLRRMTAVSVHARHADGRIPLFGDQDSGRILPESFERPPTHDNVLWLAAAVVGERRPVDGPVHAEVAWTFGVEAWSRAATLAPPSTAETKGFRDGGLYVMRSPRLHLVARCGEVGQNGSGGHGHNDVLSYELSCDGVPLIVDSGTYAYTFDVDARNAFRGSSAHNTVVVDGCEIHPIDPNKVFELRSFARPEVHVFAIDDGRYVLAGSHSGYRRLPDPLVHRRRFTLAIETDILTVTDELEGRATHLVESFLHFAEGAVVQREDDEIFAVRRAGAAVTVSFVGFAAGEIAVEEGWISDRYGVRTRAPVLRAAARLSCPASFGYTIAPSPPTPARVKH